MLATFEDSLIKPIELLMSKLSTFKRWAEMNNRTTLRPVIRNATRWSSVFDMINRYNDYTYPEILLNLSDKVISEIYHVINSNVEDLCRLTRACKSLSSANLLLQKEEISLIESRYLFDTILIDFPNIGLEKYLERDADLILSKDFLNACYRQIEGKSLSSDDILILKDFVVTACQTLISSDDEETDYGLSFLKKMKKSTSEILVYMDLRFLPTGSVRAERAFSQAGLVFSSLRKSMSCESLGLIMMLKLNRKLWDVGFLISTE